MLGAMSPRRRSMALAGNNEDDPQNPPVPSEAPAAPPARRPRQPIISIVVPTRNEASNINELWSQLNTALAGTEFEAIFVDDSDDHTPSLLAKLERGNSGRVRCRFRQGADRAGGLATAVVTGMRMAQAQYICVMDADLQHPPGTIPRMLAAAQAGADLVVASRYVGGGSRSGLDGLLRRAVSRGASMLSRLLFSEARRTTDPLAGFFICGRSLIDGIEFRPVGFKILLEMLVCIPGITVTDVPLSFAPRSSGESKASLRQGGLFLRHLMSLFFEVEGSARVWKFGAVGISGVVILESGLLLATRVWDAAPMIAFLIAWPPSLVWNTVLNHRWTFADIRTQGGNREPLNYLQRGVFAGVVMGGVFFGLTQAAVDVMIAGLVSAVVAMIINGLANNRATRRAPRLWTSIAFDRDVSEALAELARSVGADRSYLLPPRRGSNPAAIPAGLFERVITLRRAVVLTEAASHRPQRRTNIDITSTLLLPVVNGGVVVGVVVLERQAPRGFAPNALEAAVGAVETLVPLLAAAVGVPEARRLRAMASRATAQLSE